ncbi:MAG: hypothetical protein ACRDP1_10380, partial [Nocardioidaceae bacterium]
MTISVSGTGLPNVMGAADWASLLGILAGGGGSQVVDTGLAVSMGSGTRLLNVAAGTAAAAGVLFKSTATEPVTLAANGSGNSRLDLVYAQINWAAGTGSIGALAGVPAPTPTLPMLTQTAGTTWQIPLASCLVRSGVVDLTAHPGDLVDARPLYTAMQLPHHGSGL